MCPRLLGYTVRQLTQADIGQMDIIHADVFRGRSRLSEITEFVERSALPSTKVKCYGCTRIEVSQSGGQLSHMKAHILHGLVIGVGGLWVHEYVLERLCPRSGFLIECWQVDPATGKSYEVLASYTTGFAIDGHGLAEDAEALKALLTGRWAICCRHDSQVAEGT